MGGPFAQAALLAQKALLWPLDKPNPSSQLRKIEATVTEAWKECVAAKNLTGSLEFIGALSGETKFLGEELRKQSREELLAEVAKLKAAAA